jgi:hypothetical protein
VADGQEQERPDSGEKARLPQPEGSLFHPPVPLRQGPLPPRTVPYSICPLPAASMLDRLIHHNDQIPLTSNSLTRFHSRAPPNISVREYLVRIARYTNVEPCCLLILLPYVDKGALFFPAFSLPSSPARSGRTDQGAC